ncbi:Ras-related protein RabA5c-like protein [Tanacetum coccineum]
MLVGNKCDLDNIRVVSVEDGKNLAEKNGLFFMETSALDSTNVKTAFEMVIKEIYNNARCFEVFHKKDVKDKLFAISVRSVFRLSETRIMLSRKGCAYAQFCAPTECEVKRKDCKPADWENEENELGIGKVCLRLAHVYEVGEDKDDSVMANISKVTEMNLSGNQERVEMVKKRQAWKVKDLSQGKIAVGSHSLYNQLGAPGVGPSPGDALGAESTESSDKGPEGDVIDVDFTDSK